MIDCRANQRLRASKLGQRLKVYPLAGRDAINKGRPKPTSVSTAPGSSSHSTLPGTLRRTCIHRKNDSGSSLSILLKFAKTALDRSAGRPCSRLFAMSAGRSRTSAAEGVRAAGGWGCIRNRMTPGVHKFATLTTSRHDSTANHLYCQIDLDRTIVPYLRLLAFCSHFRIDRKQR